MPPSISTDMNYATSVITTKNSKQYRIRSMHQVDIVQVTAIDKSTWQDQSWPKKHFFDALNNPLCNCWVIESISTDSEVLGYGFQRSSDGVSHIMNLCIHPDQRGSGLGGILLRHMIDYASYIDVSIVELEVNTSNIRAYMLYIKHGFVTVAFLSQYYPNNVDGYHRLPMSMQNPPNIQKIWPSYVVSALAPQPYGTYIVRYLTKNDDLISFIKFNNRLTTCTPKRRYVVLSVRVDETVYKSPIMNYRLSLIGKNGQEDSTQLIEQYNLQQSKLERLPQLTHECVLPREDPTWALNSKEFQGINFTTGGLNGKNNAGVSKAIWQRSGQNDLKIFIKRFSRTTYSHFTNELTLLKKLCFFPIIPLYGQYSDQHHDYLVFADGGRSLESICPLQSRSMTSRTSRIVNIGFQISNAMIYLEKNNIVHRDLTAGNVLIDNDGYIRIADFGHAIQKEEGKNNLSRSVTNSGEEKFQVRFLAPECLLKPLPKGTNEPTEQMRKELYASFSSKSDVWSFGVLLIQLMIKTPLKPYHHIELDRDIPHHIVTEREVHPKPDECNIDLYYILQQCWAYQAIHRISFTELRQKMHMMISIFS